MPIAAPSLPVRRSSISLPVGNSTDRLHQRFTQQATWTMAIRQRAFSQFGLGALGRILEVGSGTGAVTAELRRASPGLVAGLDRDPGANAFALANDPRAVCVTGLAEQLPFPPHSFDLTCCHFLLLWVVDPLAVILEMSRVTKPGGGVLCLAEPDYGGRIDYPESLVDLGRLQEDSLRAQGADTRVGRRLRALLHKAGLTDVLAGVLGGEWPDSAVDKDAQDALEWQTLAADLGAHVSPRDLSSMQAMYVQARQERSCVLFVPTFYAWGTRPSHIPEPVTRTRQTESHDHTD